MKQAKTYLLIILTITSFIACQNEAAKKTPVYTDSLMVLETDSILQTDTIANPGDYTFDAKNATISGTLKTEMFYGAPNYGESPETDEKEFPFILVLDKPINVVQTNSKEGRDITRRGVNKIQLAAEDTQQLKGLKGKKIQVSGQFFSAFTGHHHTDVLVHVNKVKLD